MLSRAVGPSRIEGDIALSGVDLTGVAVELQLADAIGNLTQNEAARTSLLPVDVVAPAAPGLALAGGATSTQTSSMTGAVAANGATEVFITGDLIETAETMRWRPIGADPVPIILTFAPGAKTVTAKLRDGAHNESATTSAHITLSDLTPPAVHGFTLQVRDNVSPAFFVLTESTTTPSVSAITRSVPLGGAVAGTSALAPATVCTRSIPGCSLRKGDFPCALRRRASSPASYFLRPLRLLELAACRIASSAFARLVRTFFILAAAASSRASAASR